MHLQQQACAGERLSATAAATTQGLRTSHVAQDDTCKQATHTVFISDFLQDFICGNCVAGPNANPCQMRQFSPLSTSTCVTHLLLQVPETKPSHASPEAKGSQGWPEANGSQAHATLTHCVTHIHTDLKHVSSSCHMAPCTHTNWCMSRHRCKRKISHANGNLTNHMQI